MVIILVILVSLKEKPYHMILTLEYPIISKVNTLLTSNQ